MTINLFSEIVDLASKSARLDMGEITPFPCPQLVSRCNRYRDHTPDEPFVIAR